MLADEPVHAPVTVDVEVVNAIRRRWIARTFGQDAARDALHLYRLLPIRRHPVEHLVDRMWELRHNITGYDAAYVALAESLNLPLLTRDRRLANASAHAARIEYIA